MPGEITEMPLVWKGPVRIYASANNPGALEVVETIQRAMAGLELSAEPPPNATHFVLYLARETFQREAGERLADEVRAMVRADEPILMLHEKDVAKGGCEFSHFFSTTPQDLIADRLYKDLALAYYPGHFRRVSLTLIAKKLGAVSQHGLRTWRKKMHVGGDAQAAEEMAVVVTQSTRRRSASSSLSTAAALQEGL